MTRFRCAVSLPELHDERVDTSTLLGPEVVDLFEAVLSEAGAVVHTIAPRQATYLPGRSLTVRYDVTVAWPGLGSRTEWFVASVGGRTPEDAIVVEKESQRVTIWRVPHDPHLPGLALALEPHSVIRLLAELGVEVADATTRMRAYRPGRRAVVEVTAPGARLFVKVVRPRAVEALQHRHALLSGHVPVPQSLGWSDTYGMVALQAIGGRTLREVIGSGQGLPGPGALVAMLDALPDAGASAPVRSSWQTERFATLIGAAVPGLRGRVENLARALADIEAELEPDLVPVHGDFHEAQLLVDGGHITGLLDVDTFGTGSRTNDLATMIGHLSTLACASTRRRDVGRYAQRVLDVADRLVDPRRLRAAISAVVLGLATGPFRVLEPQWPRNTARRVQLAEQWLASARRGRTLSLST